MPSQPRSATVSQSKTLSATPHRTCSARPPQCPAETPARFISTHLEAQQGGGRPEKSWPHSGAAALPVRGLYRVGQLVGAAADTEAVARRPLRRADVRAVAAKAAVARCLQEGDRRPNPRARLPRLLLGRWRQRNV